MFANMMSKEKVIPPLFYSAFTKRKAEVLQCSNRKLFCEKQALSCSLTKKKCCYWRKVASEESNLRFTGLTGFTWQNSFIIRCPWQMYKDDLFLYFNCLIIPAAPKRVCCIKLISLWQSQCYSTLVWATFSWHPHQGSHSLEQKTTEDGRRISFPPKND